MFRGVHNLLYVIGIFTKIFIFLGCGAYESYKINVFEKIAYRTIISTKSNNFVPGVMVRVNRCGKETGSSL